MMIRAQEQGIELLVKFEKDVPEYYIGDIGRVRQILLNLTGNLLSSRKHGMYLLQSDAKI